MTRPLFENLDVIARRMRESPHLLIGLDYDGTLTPIVADPCRAMLDPVVRGRLRNLAKRRDTSLAIVSGRRLDDVRNRVDVEGLIYVGNHGLEIAGPDFSFVEPLAVKKSAALGCLAPVLVKELASVAGVIVEDKDLTVAVHCRQVDSADKEQVFRHVQAAVAVLPESFRIGLGHEVFEVRPRVDWHKGSALRWISGHLNKPGLLTVFVGDDQTDEDAFRVLDEAITVKVGQSSVTLAKFHVDGAEDVAQFLQWIADLDREDERE